MRWRREREARRPRPKARPLLEDEKASLLAAMTEEVAASPVLTGLRLRVRSQRGRFYLDRVLGEGESASVVSWARITPLANSDSDAFLLEHDRGKGKWTEIARGPARRLVELVSCDTRGTFHALGALDQALRESGQGLTRLAVEQAEKSGFCYAGNGIACSVQEALFHFFGVPLQVLIEPSEWYAYHRRPRIVEWSTDRSRVLVRFTSMSWRGDGIEGTCLYACRDGWWNAYRIWPSQSRDIATAEAWLVKRKWK